MLPTISLKLVQQMKLIQMKLKTLMECTLFINRIQNLIKILLPKKAWISVFKPKRPLHVPVTNIPKCPPPGGGYLGYYTTFMRKAPSMQTPRLTITSAWALTDKSQVAVSTVLGDPLPATWTTSDWYYSTVNVGTSLWFAWPPVGVRSQASVNPLIHSLRVVVT